MSETSPQQPSGSSGMPMLQPIGGGGLTPIGGGPAEATTSAPQAPASAAGPAPLSAVGGASAGVQAPLRPAPPAPYGAPPGSGGPGAYPPRPQTGPPGRPPVRPAAAADDDEDAVSAGKMIGSALVGLIVGGVCLLGWRWLWNTIHFNLSLIAVGVGFLIGITMAAVAGIGTRGNIAVTGIAGVLGLAFSVAGVWPSLTGGRIFGIIFGVFCVIVGAGAAAKAAGGSSNDLSSD